MRLGLVRWGMADGRTITLREMSDVHLANTIARLEILADRAIADDARLQGLSPRDAAAKVFPAYTYLLAERARRIEAERTAERITRLSTN